MPVLESLLKTRHYEVWILRKRGSNWLLIHKAMVNMAEDSYKWRNKVYSLKSTNLITVPAKMGTQRDLLMFNADTCEPLFIWEPDVMKQFRRSASMVAQAISEEALRNSESIETIRRQQRLLMILGIALAACIALLSIFLITGLMPSMQPQTQIKPPPRFLALLGNFLR